MFNFFHRHERNGPSKTTLASRQLAPSKPISQRLSSNLPTPPVFDSIKWALANPWLVEGQADDREPMNGAVPDSGGTAAEQRSLARRTHQVMFKKWSQARHD
jgi:hypothetical protein